MSFPLPFVAHDRASFREYRSAMRETSDLRFDEAFYLRNSPLSASSSSFSRKRESIYPLALASTWIPAFAGPTNEDDWRPIHGGLPVPATFSNVADFAKRQAPEGRRHAESAGDLRSARNPAADARLLDRHRPEGFRRAGSRLHPRRLHRLQRLWRDQGQIPAGQGLAEEVVGGVPALLPHGGQCADQGHRRHRDQQDDLLQPNGG